MTESAKGTPESYCEKETDPGGANMACTGGTRKSTFPPALAALALLVAVIGTAGAGVDAARNVGPGEAQALIRKNVGIRDFLVLDVRTPGEFAQGHLEGAVLVDYLSPGFRSYYHLEGGIKRWLEEGLPAVR